MDQVFQSLLLSQSSTGGGGGVASNPGGGGPSDGGGGERRAPRASRYARLISREALRQPEAGAGAGDGVRTAKKKEKRRTDGKAGGDVAEQGGITGAAASNKDDGVTSSSTTAPSNGDSTMSSKADGGEQNESIRVYRMDGSTGQLELLPEENYDVAYLDDDDAGEEPQEEDADKKDLAEGSEVKDDTKEGEESTAEDSEMKDAKEGEEQKSDGEDAGGDDDANTPAGDAKADDEGVGVDGARMDVDEEEPNKEDDDADSAALDEDIIYIVKGPSLHDPSTASHDQEAVDTASSSSDSDGLLDGDDDLSKSIPMHPNPLSREASSTASTLARALASRTEDFDSLLPRPESRLPEGGDSDRKKKDAVKKKLPLGAPKVKQEEKDTSKQQQDKKKDTAKEDSSSQPSLQFLQSHDLITSLPKNANVLDGDSPHTLLQLSRMRKWQESHIEPSMQGMEMDNWEDDIDWEGACETDEVEDEKKSSMDIATAATNNNAEDCTPDFKPPEPLGGHPKRPRRTQLPHYDDPMLLLLEPRNPRLEALDLTTAVNWQGAPSDDESGDESVVNVPLILESSMAGKSVAALQTPRSSRPLPFESHPNYQNRYDREMASEITSTADLAKPTGSAGLGGNEALERYKQMRQKKREQMAKDKQSRVTEVMSALSLTGTGRRITSSLMGPGGAERTGRPNRNALGGSSAHDAEYVEQLELVYNHTLVKPELTLSEQRNFHRPRLPKVVVDPACPWQFQTRVRTESKRGRGATTSADGSTVVGSYHAMMSAGAKAQNKIRNEADLSPSEGDLLLVEYAEERPPLFMTKGTTCRVVNYYRGDRSRCPISAGGGDRPLRKRHGDKAATSAGAELGPTGPSNRAERPPRLVGPNQYKLKSAADIIGIVSSKKKKKSKEAAALEAKKAKEKAIDVLPEGVTEILHQKVHGPFIGEVEEGQTQTGLVGNLFAAPMFRHEASPTDFLMICGQLKEKPKPTNSDAAQENGLGVVLRPLPSNIYCVGQTEPRVKVFAPNTNDEKKFVNAFVPYQVAKNIERSEEKGGDGLTFDDMKDRLFAHTNVPHGQLRLRIKQVANFERSNNGIWSLKAIGEDDFPGVEALGRKVSPEGVAAYESLCAAMRRLRDLGISELFSGSNAVPNVASIMIYLNGAVQAAMERRLMMKKILEVKRRQLAKKTREEDRTRLVYFEKAFEKLDGEYKELKRRQEIAKFIYEELQLSPWYLSGEFIDVHKRAVGGAMMKLTGIGDPSGLGEAYNFLRVADGRSSKSGGAKSNTDGALNAQIKKITGTENDLRKLTMKQMASLLRSYGMKDKQIAVLKRWDRVHVIRDLSTKAASDGMGDEMERFARGEKLRLSDQRQNYKERIQEIWRRQIAALSATTDANNELAASSRSDQAMGSTSTKEDATDKDEASNSDTGKDKDDASNDSDNSSDDDDFLAEMEVEMSNTGEANRLMSAQLGGGDSSMRTVGALDAQELSKDAGELAALRRQRDEERAMMLEGGLGQGGGVGGEKPKKKFKVVRRKIIKTRPDGSQTVTFEFIVNRDKVDEIIEKKKHKEGDEKKRTKKKKKKLSAIDMADTDDSVVGHVMFEDDGNVKMRRSLKLKIKKETRVVSRKGPGPKKASHSKFTSIKHSRAQAQENRKKKRMKLQEEAELYKSHVRGKGTSNRKERGSARERMPHVILADRLEAVRSAVEGRPNAGAFHKPVSRALYPHYYEIILEPIDLQTIREKNRKYDYNTADKFVADFELMKMNAIKFNGKGSPLANEAVEMWEFVKTTVEQNREEFSQMEEAVQDQMSGKKKKKAKSKAAASNDATSPSSKPMNTANVVLDGIETQVNLGTNLSFGLDGDSDDSDDS